MPMESWSISDPQSLALEGIDTLEVSIVGGRIDVIAHDDATRTDTQVEVHSVSGRPLDVRVENGRLRIGYEPSIGGWKSVLERLQGYGGRDSADVHVALPASVYARVSTVRGDGLVSGIRAGARVATVSGSVMTNNTAGALRVDTVSGEVSVSEHVGNIVMDSVSGELTATGALDEVRLDTVSGEATLDTRTIPAQISVNAVSADILFRLPDPDAMSYEVRVMSGKLLVDGIEYRGTATTFRRPGAVDSDERPLRVSAVSGNVTVLRADDIEDAAAPAGAEVPTDGNPAFGTPPTSDAPPSGGPEDAAASGEVMG